LAILLCRLFLVITVHILDRDHPLANLMQRYDIKRWCAFLSASFGHGIPPVKHMDEVRIFVLEFGLAIS
jgi:hypothetical protein